jgi:hypothetical protein
LRRFEDQVDPKRNLPADERERRAIAARRAYFARLAFNSAKARGGRKLKFTRKPEAAAAAEAPEQEKTLRVADRRVGLVDPEDRAEAA